MDSVTFRIAQYDDVESVLNYEFNKNKNPNLSDIENQMMVWNSHFRKEALEHYFKTGWSFLALDPDNKIMGFFMGQPLLFFDKQTQSLWIEYVSANSPEIFTELVDIAYRLSREKHFQRVIFSETVKQQPLTKKFNFVDWERRVNYIKTTK